MRLGINGVGALSTTAALAIILVAKFTEGAWLTLLVIPLALGLLIADAALLAAAWSARCWTAAGAAWCWPTMRRPAW